jgi:hypothetical protein
MPMPRRHCEFDRLGWLREMGSVKSRKNNSALTLPIPIGLSCGTLNLTVLEDEFREWLPSVRGLMRTRRPEKQLSQHSPVKIAVPRY